MVHVVDPPFARRDIRARRAQRQALAEVLWDSDGARRLPTERALVGAIAACHPRDVWWVCEASSAGPVYLLPTREWLRVLVRTLEGWGVRSVLEIGAGDGFLSACLARARPDWRVRATDDGSWSTVAGRMEPGSPYRHLPLSGIRRTPAVERLSATRAVERYRPDLVLVSWPPPGRMVERAIRGPARLVLELGVDGDVCGDSTPHLALREGAARRPHRGPRAVPSGQRRLPRAHHPRHAVLRGAPPASRPQRGLTVPRAS